MEGITKLYEALKGSAVTSLMCAAAPQCTECLLSCQRPLTYASLSLELNRNSPIVSLILHMHLMAALQTTNWCKLVAGVVMSKGQNAKRAPVAGDPRAVTIGMHVTLATRWIMDIHIS